MFDIHKVKPVHGWREFIGEVGIIVLGVLIALTLEQVVEIVHWHNKVNETTDTLRSTMVLHVFSAVEQQMVGPCVEQQLNIIEHNLLAPRPYKPAVLHSEPPAIPYVVRAPTRSWSDSVWGTVVAEGVSTHYEPDFRDTMDRFYNQLSQMREIARQIDQLNARMNTLSLPIDKDRLGVVDFARDIEEFKAKSEYLSLASGQILQDVRDVGLMPPRHDLKDALYKQSGTIRFCNSNHYKLNDYDTVYSGRPNK